MVEVVPLIMLPVPSLVGILGKQDGCEHALVILTCMQLNQFSGGFCRDHSNAVITSHSSTLLKVSIGKVEP